MVFWSEQPDGGLAEPGQSRIASLSSLVVGGLFSLQDVK